MSRILEGVRVLDLSQNIAGATAGMAFADHGAAVVKVEPLTGDPVRDLDGWLVWHRGKKSLALDMEQPAGREVFQRLLPGADVLVESYGPGVMDAWGLGYGGLHSRFPRLVYCAITGYGQEGKDRDRPGLGELVEARMGLQYEQAGYREGPIYLGWPVAERGGGMLAAIGTVTALLVRTQTDRGQFVDASLQNGAAFFVGSRWAWGEQTPIAEPRRRELGLQRAMGARRAVVGLFQCEDGEYVQMHTAPRGGFNRFMHAVGLHELADPDKEYEHQPSSLPQAVADKMWNDLDRIFRTKPRAEWIGILKEADLPVMPAMPPGECFDDPQLNANELIIEVDDPEYGPVRQIGIAQKFSRTPGQVVTSAPRLGEHTDAVLADAGLSAAEIGALRASGVIR